MSLSRKELEELRPYIDKAVKKFLGFTEPTLATAAINCLDKGYEKRKTVDKLRSILDDSQASKFTDKLFYAYDDFRAMSRHDRSRKRKEERRYEEPLPEVKRPKVVEPTNTVATATSIPIPEPGNPSPGQLTADKIKQMMANAQKEIRERKMQLQGSAGPPQSQQAQLMMDAHSKAKQAADLQARIQAQLANAGIQPLGQITTPVLKTTPVSSQPAPLILDDMGRTIDAKTGETVQLTHHMPTLKANIRAKKREEFKAVQEKPPEEITESKFFDQRVSVKLAMRQKRGFRFFDQGKFEQLGARMRTKAILDKLHSDIAQSAKKTGIASAAKLATITPKKEMAEGEIPDVEWWDSFILQTESYEGLEKAIADGKQVLEGITALVEHPMQMKVPAESDVPVQISVMLTKKERKKLRRQNRNEAQKETQEKIRLGLLPPPEPKVRMANLMRVLGTEAVQDPTKVEAHVRAQMVKRQKAHEETNAARKLTKEQKRDKKMNKLKEDTTLGVHVSVYRLRELKNQAKKFKVETNAQQLFMTGLVVLHKDCNVVVVEGGPKQQKKFRRLMMHRIKWEEDTAKPSKDDDDDSDDDETAQNKCFLIWEGTVKNRNFGPMLFKACPTESFAREQFRKHGVEQYWNLAFSGAVLEATGEEP